MNNRIKKSEVKVLGMDISKQSFQLHGVEQNGHIVLKKQLSRKKSRLSWRICLPASLPWKRAVALTIGIGFSPRWAMPYACGVVRRSIRKVQ